MTHSVLDFIFKKRNDLRVKINRYLVTVNASMHTNDAHLVLNATFAQQIEATITITFTM